MEWLFFLSIIFSFVLFCTFVQIAWPSKNFPPGPFQFPILGSLPQILLQDRKLPHVALAKLAKKYGPLMSFGLGVHKAVVISSHKLIKETFNSGDFKERYPLPFIRDRNFGRDDLGIIFSSNLALKQYFLRKVNALGFKSKARLDRILLDASEELISAIQEERNGDTGAWASNHQLFAFTTTNCLWGFVAGFRFDTDNPLLVQAVEMTKALAGAIGLNNVYTPFPFLKKMFPVWSGYEEHKMIYTTQYQAMRKIIEEFKKKRATGAPEVENTILACFFDDMGKGKEGFNEQQLLVLLSDLLIASDETTSTMMIWTLLYLAKYPSVQSKLYEKIVESFGQDEIPSLENISRITYLKAVIYEILRSINFVPLSFPCSPGKDVQMNGFVIPKGSCVMYNTYPVHNDPEFWGDPENFRPERFITKDELGKDKLTKTERVYGFGSGKRICAGEEFGWNFLQMFTVHLLKKFQFSVLPGDNPSLEPTMRINVSPADYSLKVTDRK